MIPSRDNSQQKELGKRFRGFLPVVVDVETAGFNAQTDALLEIAAFTIHHQGCWRKRLLFHEHIEPFVGANLEPDALAFNGIIPNHPFRFAKKEHAALSDFFKLIQKNLHTHHCQRAVLVGHNPMFDLSFLQAAAKRCALKKDPFHPFTTFDTATLAALAVGQTVLARACQASGIRFDNEQAHSALHDAECTAELFCTILNRWQK